VLVTVFGLGHIDLLSASGVFFLVAPTPPRSSPPG
jgi:hypothetical protein